MIRDAFQRFSLRMDLLLARFDAHTIRASFEKLAQGRWKPELLLVAVCLLLYLPGIASIPPLDRDEPRYIQASRQMVETGDYTRIYFQDHFRNKKPVGIYWLQAGTVNLLGGEKVKDLVWPYRLPSLLCAIGSVMLVFRIGTRLIGKPQGLMAGLLFAATPLLLAIARFGTTDSTLLFFTTLTQYNLIQIYLDNREKRTPKLFNAVLFWVAMGAGVLVKGPITPLIALLTGVSLAIVDRNPRALKGLRPWLGVPLLLAIVLPWLISIQIATDGAFLRDSLGGDFGKKLVSGQESHGAPPGFYTLLMAVTCWPSSLLIVPAMLAAWRTRRQTATAAICFCWVVPYLVLLELVPTKLPHYILSAYPPLVLLATQFAWMENREVLNKKIWKGLHWLYRTVWALVFPLTAVVMLLCAVPSRHHLLPIPAAAVLALGAVAVARLRKRSALLALAGSIPLLAFMAVVLFGLVAPRLDPIWVIRSAADAFRQLQREQPSRTLYSVGYSEPSLVFLAGTQTKLCGMDMIAAEYGTNMVALLPDAVANELPAELEKVATIHGINYSKGKFVESGLYIPKADGHE
ncbi:MAG: glycosyltransferase family 39 protein [Kiritimatiellales bacterium]|nr:glycosyltransferase family 39 protein [Kiritimatiellales bacterium]